MDYVIIGAAAFVALVLGFMLYVNILDCPTCGGVCRKACAELCRVCGRFQPCACPCLACKDVA